MWTIQQQSVSEGRHHPSIARSSIEAVHTGRALASEPSARREGHPGKSPCATPPTEDETRDEEASGGLPDSETPAPEGLPGTSAARAEHQIHSSRISAS